MTASCSIHPDSVTGRSRRQPAGEQHPEPRLLIDTTPLRRDHVGPVGSLLSPMLVGAIVDPQWQHRDHVIRWKRGGYGPIAVSTG